MHAGRRLLSCVAFGAIMSFHDNRYLPWYVPRLMRHDDAINLHSSGVEAIDPATLDVPGGDPWSQVPAFESALADWLGIPAEELIFAPGATGGTLLALLTLADRDAELLVEDPIYEPMMRQAERLGRVERFGRRGPAFELPLDEARQRLSKRTAVVMITEPHNPSGRFAPREQVLELAAAAGDHGATLLINEVYRGYTDRPSYHLEASNIVVVSSLSKLMGAYSFRLGWISGPTELVGRLRRAHQNMSMPTMPGAAAGIAILGTGEERQARARGLVTAGLPTVNRWVEATAGLSWLPSEGPGFGSVRLPEGIDDVALGEHLHDARGVLAVPGTMFGLPGTLRVSWLQTGDRLEEGLGIVAEELSASARR